MSFSFKDDWLNAVNWVEELKHSEWAEQNIYFNMETSPISGAFNFDNTPYLKEILNDLDRDNIQEVMIFTATQWAKTTVLFIVGARVLDYALGKSMLVIPTQDMVSTYVKDKVDPFLSGVETIQDKIENQREETKAGKLESALKRTRGASLRIAGNTRHTRSSYTVKYLLLDEIRLYPSGTVEELKGRTKAFELYGRKIIMVSSKENDTCEATMNYEKMDIKKEHKTYCSNCKSLFWAGSEQFYYPRLEDYIKKTNEENPSIYRYKKYALDNVSIKCPNCGFKIDESTRRSNITKGLTRFDVVQGNIETDTSIGYKSNTLYSLLSTMQSIASELIDAHGDEDKLSRIYRDYFNEAYNQKIENVDIEEFLLLDNGLKQGVVPEDTWKLILTIDNQKDHVYFEINAVQYGDIKNTVLHGKIEGYGIGEDWNGAFELATKGYPTENGNIKYIDYAGVDRRGYNQDGHSRTDEANAFIIRLMEWAEDNGIVDNFAYGLEGVPKISGDEYIKIREDKNNTTKDGKKLKVISFSNLKIKNRLSNMIARGIKYKKKEDKRAELYNKKMMFINNDIADDARSRIKEAENKGKEYIPPKWAYESHYTAETYNPKKGIWENAKQKRVDYMDCGTMCEAISIANQVDTAIKDDYQDSSTIHDILANMNK